MSGSKGKNQILGVLLIAVIVGGFTGFIAGMVGGSGVDAATVVTPPNHPPLVFWGTPNDGITLNAQGTGQIPSQAFSGKNSGPTTSNQAIHKGTVYCTGLTSKSWSPIVSGDTVFMVGQVAILNVNVTVSYWSISYYIGANGVVPSTTFGTGNCASLTGVTQCVNNNQVPVANLTVLFPTDCISTRTTGTYYAWVQVVLVNTAINPTDVKASFTEAAASAIATLEDKSNVNAPPAGSASASSNLGTWPLFPSALTQAPLTQSYPPIPATLQSQTTQVQLTIWIKTSAVFGGSVDTSAFVWAQYSSDSGASWHNLCGGTDGGGDGTMTPRIDVTQAPSSTMYKSGYCTIASGAFATGGVLLRVVGDGGDDGTTFQASYIGLDMKP